MNKKSEIRFFSVRPHTIFLSASSEFFLHFVYERYSIKVLRLTAGLFRLTDVLSAAAHAAFFSHNFTFTLYG